MNATTEAPTSLAAPESEAVLIGATLAGGDDYGFATIRPHDFTDPRNAETWTAIIELQAEGTTPQLAAVVERLKERGRADLEIWTRELEDRHGWAESPSYHADIVRNRAVRRRLDGAGRALREDAHKLDASLADLLDRAERRVFGLAEHSDSDRPRLIKHHLLPVIQLIESGGYKGVPTGYVDLDRALTGGGTMPGQLVAIAGGTSMGKTAMGLGIATNMSIEGRIPVAYFSIEMDAEQNTLRILAAEARADLKALCEGTATDHDMVNLATAAGHLNTAPLHLHSGATTVPEIRAQARRLKAEVPDLAAIFVDHIHDMDHPSESRREQMGAIARGLKGIAMELGITVFALAQLKRVEGRTDTRPRLSDLKESGDIENSCDIALLLHRPEYYVSDKEAQEGGIVGLAECIIGKQRNGPTPSIPLTWSKHCARFENRGSR